MSTIPEVTRPAFMDSRTCRALSAACLGESAARRLYLAAACAMEDAALHVIAHALRFTAAQEQEHEAIFRGLLTANGAPAPVLQEEPRPLPHSPEELLAHIIQTESDEAEKLYPHNARIAAEEVYPRIAATFLRVGETEALHAKRFRQYAKALADGTLFRDDQRISWLCLGCGQFHAGLEAPPSCTACGRNQGHFIRSNHHPFMVEG